MIIEIPDDNSIVKWKKHDDDDWKSAEISDLIAAYEESEVYTNDIYILLNEMRTSILSMDLSYSRTIKLVNQILKIEAAVDRVEGDKKNE